MISHKCTFYALMREKVTTAVFDNRNLFVGPKVEHRGTSVLKLLSFNVIFEFVVFCNSFSKKNIFVLQFPFKSTKFL